MAHRDVDAEMAQIEEQEILEAHRRRRNLEKARSIFKDDSVTLFTLEGQLKICGCLVVLAVALATLAASICAISYVSVSASKRSPPLLQSRF